MRPSIEIGADDATDRRLVGTVVGRQVDLAVRDQRLWTRRVGWRVEFHGSLEESTGGAILEGTIDFSDRRQIGAYIVLLGLTGALVALLAIALAIRDAAGGSAIALGPVAFGFAIAGITIFGATRLKSDIDRAAADDARLLAAFLDRVFR